jgi:hypothetical protein
MSEVGWTKRACTTLLTMISAVAIGSSEESL